MYDFKKDYDNFIDEEYIWNLIRESEKATKEDIAKVLDKAKEMKGLSHQDVAILLNIKDGVTLNSEPRKTANPAGLIPIAEKSPPNAPKALPMAMERAVPVGVSCE